MRLFLTILPFLALAAGCFDKNFKEDTAESFVDADGDGYDEVVDCDDTNPTAHPGGTEVCNGYDDDCDGFVDDADPDVRGMYEQYLDADGDGYGDPSTAQSVCVPSPGSVTNDQDCDDTDPMIHPGVEEQCDGVDNDCNGVTDVDADPTQFVSWYLDGDGDGYGDSHEMMTACQAPLHYVADATDCDDVNPNIFPGADEYCNTMDDDCDGFVDEEALDADEWYRDADADGYGDPSVILLSCDLPIGYSSGGSDCDDANSAINPDANEVCNGYDDDCDGLADDDDPVVNASTFQTYYQDADGDGFGDATMTIMSCGQPAGYVVNSTDCDDTDSTVNPAAAEDCGDGIDNDCDPTNDDQGDTYFADVDGDGFGDSSDTLLNQCSPPAGYVTNDEDCDDTRANINPSQVEMCDGADNDCDGATDEPDAADVLVWYRDADADGYGDVSDRQVSCTQPLGYVADATDCDDGEPLSNPGETEVCDGLDNNCNGWIDNPSEVTDGTYWYQDADADGYGDPSYSTYGCTAPMGSVTDHTDCNDADTASYPGADEYCDTNDNDCDGFIDEDDAVDALSWYADADGDGYGNPAMQDMSCYGSTGYVPDARDCNDTDSSINPSAVERCDEVDNDCDGTMDEADAVDASVWYRDADSDGYGDVSVTVMSCGQPAGYVADATDCDDGEPLSNPGETEVCDGLDNDCNGTVDEPSAIDAGTWYQDADADGYGSMSLSVRSCSAPMGYIARSGDCDDSDPASNPGEDEVCDAGVDNDCDGLADESDSSLVDGSLFYRDADADGYGDASVTAMSCVEPAGYVADATDCDDTDSDINPDSFEIGFDPLLPGYLDDCADGADNDCDGSTDATDWECMDADADGNYNGMDLVYSADQDGDASGIYESVCVLSVSMPTGYEGFDAYVQDSSAGFYSTSIYPTASSLISLSVDGQMQNAWCRDFSISGNAYSEWRFLSAQSAANPANPLAPSDCGTWQRMDINNYCEYQIGDDPFCYHEYSFDRCGVMLRWHLWTEWDGSGVY